MSPASTTAKSDPASSLNRYFEAANADFRGFTQFMNDIDRPCLHIFWGGRKSSFSFVIREQEMQLTMLG